MNDSNPLSFIHRLITNTERKARMPSLEECIKEAFRYMKRAEMEATNGNYEKAMTYSLLAQNYLTIHIAITMGSDHENENAISGDNLS